MGFRGHVFRRRFDAIAHTAGCCKRRTEDNAAKTDNETFGASVLKNISQRFPLSSSQSLNTFEANIGSGVSNASASRASDKSSSRKC